MIPYRTLRTIHLVSASFALPALLMYGVSAVQMAHSRWFTLKPAVTTETVEMGPDYRDGRKLATDVMSRAGFRGEIESVETTAAAIDARVVVPGTVREIRYDPASGKAAIKTSVAGLMGMLNRLHHAAGLGRSYLPLRLWGALMLAVAIASMLLGATGLWMWWLRGKERRWGVVLLAANLVFSVAVLGLLRSAGP